MKSNWTKEINATITVCDENGIIVDLNDKALKEFEDDGGKKLIGTKLLDCHPDPLKEKVQNLLSAKKMNCYTVEKNGKKKFVCHAPWFDDGEYKGFLEMIIGIPFDMPHYVRD